MSDSTSLFAGLKYPGTGRYFTGLALSMIGSWMQSIALSWLVVHDLKGGGTALAVLGIFQFGPTLVLGAWAGALADRMDKRSIMLITQVALGLSALALAVLDFTNHATLPLVVVLAGVAGIATAFDTPVRRSIIGDLVPKSALPNAMSLNTGVITSTRVLGMTVGGYLTKFAGTEWCFLVNAISYVAMIVALSGMVNRKHDVGPPTSNGGVRDAIAHVWRTPVLRISMIATVFVATFTFNYQITFPLLIKSVFDRQADSLGTMLAITSAGTFGGALISARRAKPALSVFLVACVLMGAGAIGMAFAPTYAWCNGFSVPMGLGGGLLMSQLSGLLTANSDPTMRGRVLALQTVVFLGSTPIGGPIIGFVADRAGSRWAMAVGGFAALLGGLWGAIAMRSLPAEAPSRPQPAAS